MEDFPTKIADLLESTTGRIRALTVDRAATAVRWIAAGPVLTVLVVVALLFLFLGLFRILAEVMHSTRGAYAVIGGLFLLGAGLLFSKRRTPDEDAS